MRICLFPLENGDWDVDIQEIEEELDLDQLLRILDIFRYEEYLFESVLDYIKNKYDESVRLRVLHLLSLTHDKPDVMDKIADEIPMVSALNTEMID